MARALFDRMGPIAKIRVGGDPRKIELAIRARLEMGDDARPVFNAAMMFIRDPWHGRDGGKHAAQLHKLIEVGFPPLWVTSGKALEAPETFSGKPLVWAPPEAGVAAPAPAPPQSSVSFEGHEFEIPPDQTGLNSRKALGLVMQQIGWLREWSDDDDRRLELWQSHDRGPAPGRPLCRIWPSVLEHLCLPPTPAYQSSAA